MQATDSEDEEDYSALCRYFCGEAAAMQYEAPLANTARAVARGELIDQDHAFRASDKAICRLSTGSLSSLMTKPSIDRESGSHGECSFEIGESKSANLESTTDTSSTCAAADLKLPPTRSELREARNEALATLHKLFDARGVRHLDNDLQDVQWSPYSDAHVVKGRLGVLQDVYRAVLEEYVDQRRGEHDDDDFEKLLATLGVLRAKAGDIQGSRQVFSEAAATELLTKSDELPEVLGPQFHSLRLKRAVTERSPRVRPRATWSWKALVPKSALPTASWRATTMPLASLDKSDAESRLLVRTGLPVGVSDDPSDAICARACRTHDPPPLDLYPLYY